MKVLIEINTGNDAFARHPDGPSGETARILREIADKIQARDSLRRLDFPVARDENGNRVGEVTYEGDLSEE